MTCCEITAMLSAAGIENAAHEAALLIEHFEGVTRAQLMARGRSCSYNSEKLTEAVKKRCSRYPLQYILGSWEFCGLEFEVNEDCLIPRSDTETAVEEAVRRLCGGGHFLDLCTGSGCIAAAVLSLTKNTTADAVELYPETAALAVRNIRRLGLGQRCRVICGDACTDLFDETVKFKVITANPPYVTADEMNGLEPELRAEPVHALTDGGDGLSIIEAIVSVYKKHLCEDGAMIIEHGSSQKEAAAVIARKNGMESYCIADYSGNDRCTVMTFPR